MNDKERYHKRKHPRLKEYDYSSPGRYFITICTKDRRCILSDITVGRGEAQVSAPASTHLTETGLIVEKELITLPLRYPELTINKYVIMPNHLHVVFSIITTSAGASPRPTIMDMICAFKSLTSRNYKALGFSDSLWQPSFYEHIIRSEKDYLEIWTYIDNNPAQWAEDEYYR